MGRGGHHCEHDGMNDWWVGGRDIQGGGWVMPRRAMHGMYYFLVNQDEAFLSAADSQSSHVVARIMSTDISRTSA